MTYDEWAARWPQAAAELQDVIAPGVSLDSQAAAGSEAAAQQQVRLAVARAGAFAWRNNVGATPTASRHTCPRCSFAFEEKQTPIRYGLCNDSMQLNARIKSADLIGIRPLLITPDLVGQRVGQFLSIEVKRPGWAYTGKGQEPGQMAWAALVQRAGGLSMFSTGGVTL